MQKLFFSKTSFIFLLVFTFSAGFISCKKKIKVSEDTIYSRHLQHHMTLHIITTPPPEEKNDFNLLILNDGQDIGKLDAVNIIDSLWNKKLLQPVVLVGIDAWERIQTYGVAGYPDYQGNGTKAQKYEAFLENELLPYIKKMTGIRKFNSVTIAGFSLGGLAALNFAWDHGDKINKVGVFSGSFWVRDKDDKDPSYTDERNRIMINKIRSSRKRPKLKYWFYAGGNEEKNDRDKDGIIDVIDDTKDIINTLSDKSNVVKDDVYYMEMPAGIHDYATWRTVFPKFLLWSSGVE